MCLLPTYTVWADAEKNIDIEITGLEKDLSETMLNGLSINRQKQSPTIGLTQCSSPA